MRAGDLLKNIDTDEERFRVKRLLAEGRSYYIAEGEDTLLEDLRVILKAIKYPDAPTRDLVTQRREALHTELEALTVPSILLPEPIDFFYVDSDVGVGDRREPVLVLEHYSGRTLRAEMARTPTGMNPQRALKIVHEVALALEELHEAGWVFRDLNPDHVIVGIDDIIHLVGTGNIARMEQRPSTAKVGVSDRYSAPEIRDELSGRFLSREADVYSLGALFAYMLTGVDPSPRVESPLPPDAYERLLALPEGYQLLVTRCMQPMAKRRFRTVAALKAFLHPANLPTKESRGFAKLDLPVPFTPEGQPALDNRALRSKLSTGPLISVPPERPAATPEAGQLVKQEKELPARVEKAPWWKSCLPWLAAQLTALIALMVALVELLAG